MTTPQPTPQTDTVDDDDFKVPVKPLSNQEKFLFDNSKWLLPSLALGYIVYFLDISPQERFLLSQVLLLYSAVYLFAELWRWKRTRELRGAGL
jgi:hypothetical protein